MFVLRAIDLDNHRAVVNFNAADDHIRFAHAYLARFVRTEGAVLGGVVGAGIGGAVGNANDKYRCDSRGPYYSYGDTIAYREAPDYRDLMLELANGSVRLCANDPKYHCWQQ